MSLSHIRIDDNEFYRVWIYGGKTIDYLLTRFSTFEEFGFYVSSNYELQKMNFESEKEYGVQKTFELNIGGTQ